MNTVKLLSGDDVCRRLGVAQATLYGWVSEGRIEVTKVGRLNRFTEAAIDAFLFASSRKTPGLAKNGLEGQP